MPNLSGSLKVFFVCVCASFPEFLSAILLEKDGWGNMA